MNYNKIHRIKFSPTISIQDLVELIRRSTTNWIMLADISYRCVEQPGELDISDDRVIYVPSLLPYSDKIKNPFGRRINHIAIQANLKTQPVMSGPDVAPDFLPMALIGSKAHLMRLVARCESAEDLFLELSMKISNFKPKVHEEWLATAKLRDASQDSRAQLISHYFPAGSRYFESCEGVAPPAGKRSMTPPNLNRDGFIKIFHVVNNKPILLTQNEDSDYQFVQYDYITFSTDPAVNSDYYIALPGANLAEFDLTRTFAQSVLPSPNSPAPVFAYDYDPLGIFAVKQFSPAINFSPPFTNSSNSLLTALEIIISCRPSTLLVNSNSVFGDLVASGTNAEAIKRQVFVTKLVDHCVEQNIPFKILGDACRLTAS